MKILSQIYWFLYRLTPRGKKAWTFKKGLEGLRQRRKDKNIAKMDIIHNANKKLKQKKLLAFNKGSSVSKAKKSDHEVIEAAKKESAERLEETGLKINKKGKFKDA